MIGCPCTTSDFRDYKLYICNFFIKTRHFGNSVPKTLGYITAL